MKPVSTNTLTDEELDKVSGGVKQETGKGRTGASRITCPFCQDTTGPFRLTGVNSSEGIKTYHCSHCKTDFGMDSDGCYYNVDGPVPEFMW